MPTISAPFVWRAPSSTQPRNRPRVICSECGGRVGPHAYLTILDAYRGSPRPVIMCDATDVAHDPSGSYSLELHAGNPADTADSLWHLGTKDWARGILGECGALIAIWWASMSTPPGARR